MFRLGRPTELDRVFRAFLSPTGRPLPRWLLPLVVRPGDALLLFCGEIDVRVHFGRFGADQPEQHVETLVTPFLAELSAWGRQLGCRVAVASVTPPSANTANADFPVLGSLSARVRWTQAVNVALATDGRVRFVDFHHHYADARGTLDRNVADTSVHIERRWNAGVVEAVRTAGLLTSPANSRHTEDT
jgi:hypothetical protein